MKSPAISLPLHGLSLALSFLSRLSSVMKSDWSDSRIWSWSFVFYPAVGLLLGLIASLPLVVFFKLPAAESLMLLSTLFYVASLEWLTRFLHFDGLCDCCDAFSAMSLSKERRLEIMKDPHVGSSAVGAACLLLIGKTLIIYLLLNKALLLYDDAWKAMLALIAVPGLARLAMLCLAAVGRYPRESGTAMNVVGKVPLAALLLAAVSMLPVFWNIGLLASAIATLSCLLMVFYWKAKADAKIGGVTGDVLGACAETGELAAAAGFLLALEIGL
jgi:adenosylcobinamide-GDP ribazoletransferase